MPDGSPFGPHRFRELSKVCWFISKSCNTSYEGVLKMTPREREYVLEFIKEDYDKQAEMLRNRGRKQ